jgi:hypothetical protein
MHHAVNITQESPEDARRYQRCQNQQHDDPGSKGRRDRSTICALYAGNAIRFVEIGGRGSEQPHTCEHPGSKRPVKPTAAPCGPGCRVNCNGLSNLGVQQMFSTMRSTNESAGLRERMRCAASIGERKTHQRQRSPHYCLISAGVPRIEHVRRWDLLGRRDLAAQLLVSVSNDLGDSMASVF